MGTLDAKRYLRMLRTLYIHTYIYFTLSANFFRKQVDSIGGILIAVFGFQFWVVNFLEGTLNRNSLKHFQS